MKKNQKSGVIWSVFFLLFLLPTVIFKALDLRVIYNASSSLNGSVFILQKRPVTTLQIGDLVVFKHVLFKDRLLLKRVSHLEGEAYKAENTLLHEEEENRKTQVEARHVAVTGDHIRSFDSRYERFGFIPKSTILGKAWKIW